MNRLTMTFIVLSATGGCMALDRDPIDDYPYGPPRRPAAQSQSWAPSNQGNWRGWDGKPVQTASADLGSRSYGASTSANNSWMNPPQTTTAAKKTVKSGSSTAMASKSSRSADSKGEDALMKATYTEAKGARDDDDDDLPLAKPAKPAPAKKTAMETLVQPAIVKSPPVNLGVLRLINSKRITFHYEVKDPASAGVAGLELWGTTDMRNWKKYDIVTRTPSSLIVDVREEGLYGFTMIARGKGEVAKNQPPMAGEPPQVWVAVDLTKPVVQLLGAELNIMTQTPSLVVRWNAKDRNFGPRPMTLLYSDRLEGPWSPIAANVENSGRYEWMMPACVPSNVYVRVQAIDMMGNMGMAQSTTLHIPGRALASSSARSEPALADPPRLGNTLPPPPTDGAIRPISASVLNPAVSILSVDSD